MLDAGKYTSELDVTTGVGQVGLKNTANQQTENVEQVEQIEDVEQISQEIERLNNDARLDVRRAEQTYNDLSGKIEKLFSVVDTSSTRKGKDYSGLDKINDALQDARDIINAAVSPEEGLTDATNNILGSLEQKMNIILRETDTMATHLQKAEQKMESVQDPDQRSVDTSPDWKTTAVRWEKDARDILAEIQNIEDDAHAASDTAKAGEARKAAQEAAGW